MTFPRRSATRTSPPSSAMPSPPALPLAPTGLGTKASLGRRSTIRGSTFPAFRRDALRTRRTRPHRARGHAARRRRRAARRIGPGTRLRAAARPACPGGDGRGDDRRAGRNGSVGAEAAEGPAPPGTRARRDGRLGARRSVQGGWPRRQERDGLRSFKGLVGSWGTLAAHRGDGEVCPKRRRARSCSLPGLGDARAVAAMPRPWARRSTSRPPATCLPRRRGCWDFPPPPRFCGSRA